MVLLLRGLYEIVIITICFCEGSIVTVTLLLVCSLDRPGNQSLIFTSGFALSCSNYDIIISQMMCLVFFGVSCSF